MKIRLMLLAFALALPAVPATVYAADVPQQDKQWVKNTYQVTIAAIKAGKAAQSQGESAIVDKVAKKIMADDQHLQDKLKTLADEMGISLPDSTSAKLESALQMVKSKSGAKFDKLWTKTMLKTEIMAGNKTQKEVARGQSHKVKQLAVKTLPTINLEANMLQHALAKLK
ncbi:MAG TPA: DUF4142 domain-containing protein [Gammaproteobacteria bacterium]|nr:DUF4142 domain-containing protein [Gammaproteobacteria bacterium]